MVLDSQTPRTGLTRQRLRGRRRSSASKWLMYLVALALVAGGGWFLFLRSDEEPGQGAAGATPGETSSAMVTADPVQPATGSVKGQPTAEANVRPVPQPPAEASTRSGSNRMDENPLVQVPEPPPGNAAVRRQLLQGMKLIEDGQPIQGRRVLSELLVHSAMDLPDRDLQAIRDILASVNRRLVFAPDVYPGDPVAETYVVQSGDALSIVTRRYFVPYQLIEQINRIEANRIRVGQKLKMIRGPFHAVVDKSAFRMDIFIREPATGAGGSGQVAGAGQAATEAQGPLVYVCSFPVGVGESDSTPVGRFLIDPRGKLSNPGWTNPRTGQTFAPDDPANPIGEFWLGLQGTDENTKDLLGYGIHGTIDPQSIGRQMSMGCVRLGDADVAQVYRLLYPGLSTVVIHP